MHRGKTTGRLVGVGRRLRRAIRGSVGRRARDAGHAARPELPAHVAWTWYSEGDRLFAAVLEAIAGARLSVRLETYIFEASGIGIRIRDAIAEAARRGAKVRVLVDAFGSSSLPSAFWKPLRDAGGDVQVFNPPRVARFGIRDHRKLLVCDDEIAFVGGFNIAPNYEGDGVERGWRDVALRVSGPLAAALGKTFDRMYAAAEFRRKAFIRFRPSEQKRAIGACGCEILLSGPGRGGSPLLRALRRDLKTARTARIMVAYFLPTRRLRTALTRAARRDGVVELILPGKSDVPLSKLAAESLYRRLLRARVRVFEYQPQMLHGKLFIIDNAVYVGSSNLDPRSLRVNYELMLRIEGETVAAAARGLFEDCLQHSREVHLADWMRRRSLWTRLKQRWAHFILVRLDPWIALSQWRAMPD
jgi:cardiolipin synthase A/B